MRLADRTIVVTGASSGFGRLTAKLLASKGATVWAVARNEERLRSLADEQDGIRVLVADLTVEADRARVAETVGTVDALVNNAGLGWMGLVETMPAEKVRQLIELNVVAVIDLTQRLLPGMLAQGRGHIINVSSIAAYVSAPPLTVYSATKWAVQGFTEGLRRELIGRGVSVTSINPGPFNTEFGERAMGDETGDHAPRTGAASGLVAHAIYRALLAGPVPGYQVVTVPRALGLLRVGAIPGVARLVDVATLPVRLAFPRR